MVFRSVGLTREHLIVAIHLNRHAGSVNGRHQIVLRLPVIPSEVEGSLELLTALFLGHFPAPAQDLRFRACSLGFLDVSGAVVK